MISSLPRPSWSGHPSGATIINIPNKSLSGLIGLWIDTGTKSEVGGEGGAAHFLEHMLFKGTPSLNEGNLVRFVEGRGMMLNAYTSRDHTVLLNKFRYEDTADAVGVLLDVFLNANISHDSVNREKDVILKELNAMEEDETEYLFDLVHEDVYGGGRYGRRILGLKLDVETMTREKLINFKNRNFAPSKLKIVSVGGCNEKELRKTTSAFLTKSRNIVKPLSSVNGLDVFSKGAIEIHRKPVKHERAAITFEGPTIKGNDIRDSAFSSITHKLLSPDGDLSFGFSDPYSLIIDSYGLRTDVVEDASRYKLSVEGGLTFFNIPYSSSGIIGATVMASTPARLEEAISHAVGALSDLPGTVSRDMFEDAKERVAFKIGLAMIDPDAIMDIVGRRSLASSHSGSIYYLSRLKRTVERASYKEYLEFCNRRFNKEFPSVTVLTRTGELTARDIKSIVVKGHRCGLNR